MIVFIRKIFPCCILFSVVLVCSFIVIPNASYGLGSHERETFTLRRGKTFASQLTKANTVYEIRYTFDLKGGFVTVPQGSVLVFNGGQIRNGTLIGTGTGIECLKTKQIVSNVILDGTWDVEIAYPEWFGAAGDGVRDDRKAVQAAFDIGNTIVLEKDYLIKNAPFDYRNFRLVPENELDYYLDVLDQKNRTSDAQLTPLKLSSGKKVVISGLLKAYSPLGVLLELKGDNSVITGGGTISGCGIVNTVNVYSGKREYAVTNWESALIYIKGSNNRVEGITIKNPTRQGISIDDYLSKNNVIINNVIGGGLKAHTQDVESCSFTGLFGIYARGTNTFVKDNEFRPIDGKSVYDALYCNYTTTNVPSSVDERTEIHTVLKTI